MLKIDSTSSVPVYAQIVEQVKRAVASGTLKSGDMLPSRRELALKLEINPLTVLKAYKQLEVEGLIEIRQGLGCFVADGQRGAVESYRLQTLTRQIDTLLSDAREFGVSPDRLREMIGERMRHLGDEPPSEDGNE